MNVKIIMETGESDNFLMAYSVTVSVSASNIPAHKLKKICEVHLGRQMNLKCILSRKSLSFTMEGRAKKGFLDGFRIL